ncbi:MAG: methyltransferase, partial [Thermoanaerobaculia bacterium]
PVDYLSRAIVHISMQNDSLGKAFHIVNPRPLALNDMVAFVRSQGYALEKVPPERWRTEMVRRAERSPQSAMSPFLSKYTGKDQAASERPRLEVDWRNTRDALAGSGIVCPAVDRELFGTYFSYFRRIGFLPDPCQRSDFETFPAAAAGGRLAPRRSRQEAAAEEIAAAPSAAEAPPAFASSSLWQTLQRSGQRQARRLAAEAELLAEVADEPRIDQLSAAFVASALRRLGIFAEPGESHTIEELVSRHGVPEGHRKVVRRWLEMLTEDGLLRHRGETYVSPMPLPADSFASLVTEKESHLSPDALVTLLKGQRHVLEFFIPGDSSQEIEAAYRQAPMFRYCNGICEALLQEILAVLDEDWTLRLAEIGAGTGGTSASLLPLLPAERTVYLYTDISKFFTDLARRKFADYRFLRYAELDIERDPEAQGIEPGSFDLVVAAHVLHATRRIDETLGHVRSLLRPNGFLLLLEETRFRRQFNFSMGFLPGFDRFEDYELRRLHPLLSSAAWKKALLDHGFDKILSFTEPGSPAEVLGVDVLLARAERRSRAADPARKMPEPRG